MSRFGRGRSHTNSHHNSSRSSTTNSYSTIPQITFSGLYIAAGYKNISQYKSKIEPFSFPDNILSHLQKAGNGPKLKQRRYISPHHPDGWFYMFFYRPTSTAHTQQPTSQMKTFQRWLELNGIAEDLNLGPFEEVYIFLLKPKELNNGKTGKQTVQIHVPTLWHSARKQFDEENSTSLGHRTEPTQEPTLTNNDTNNDTSPPTQENSSPNPAYQTLNNKNPTTVQMALPANSFSISNLKSPVENLFDGLQGTDLIFFEMDALMSLISTQYVDQKHGGQPLHLVYNLEKFLKQAIQLEMKIIFIHFTKCHQLWTECCQPADNHLRLSRKEFTPLEKISKLIVLHHLRYIENQHKEKPYSKNGFVQLKVLDHWKGKEWEKLFKNQTPSFVVTHHDSLPFSLHLKSQCKLHVVQSPYFENQTMWGNQIHLREKSHHGPVLSNLFDEKLMIRKTPLIPRIVPVCGGDAVGSRIESSHLKLISSICTKILSTVPESERRHTVWCSICCLISVLIAHGTNLKNRNFSQFTDGDGHGHGNLSAQLSQFFCHFHNGLLQHFNDTDEEIYPQVLIDLFDGRMITCLYFLCNESNRKLCCMIQDLVTDHPCTTGVQENPLQSCGTLVKFVRKHAEIVEQGAIHDDAINIVKQKHGSDPTPHGDNPHDISSWLDNFLSRVGEGEIPESTSTTHHEDESVLRQHYHSRRLLDDEVDTQEIIDAKDAPLREEGLKRMGQLRSKDEIVYLSNSSEQGKFDDSTIALWEEKVNDCASASSTAACDSLLKLMLDKWIAALRGGQFKYKVLCLLLQQLLHCVKAASKEIAQRGIVEELNSLTPSHRVAMAEYFHRVYDCYCVLQLAGSAWRASGTEESSLDPPGTESPLDPPGTESSLDPPTPVDASNPPTTIQTQNAQYILSNCMGDSPLHREELRNLIQSLSHQFKQSLTARAVKNFHQMTLSDQDKEYIEWIQFVEAKSFHYLTKMFPRFSQDKMIVLEYYPDPWQEKFITCIDQNASENNGKTSSLIVTTPTSSGKTFLVQYVIERVLKTTEKGTMIFVAPTLSLCSQVYAAVYNKFQQDPSGSAIVGLFTAHDRINMKKCRVLIVTPECLRILLLSPNQEQRERLIENLQYVVFDEIHQIADSQHTESWMSSMALLRCPFIALSASISNSEDFSDWIKRFLKNDFDLKVLPDPSCDVPIVRNPPIEYYTWHPASRFVHLHPVGLLGEEGTQNLKSLSYGEVEVLLEQYKSVNQVEAMKWCREKREIFDNDIHRLDPEKYAIFRQRLEGWFSNMQSCSEDVRQLKNQLYNSIQHRIQNGDRDDRDDRETPTESDTFYRTAQCILDCKESDHLPALCFIFNRNQIHRASLKLISCMMESGKSLLDQHIDESKIGLPFPVWQSTKVSFTVPITVKNEDLTAMEEYLKRHAQYQGNYSHFSRVEDVDGKRGVTFTVPIFVESEEGNYRRFNHAEFHKLHCNAEFSIHASITCASAEDEFLLSLRYGIGFHYNKLTPLQKQTVERLFCGKELVVTFATGTLAYGINMPTKSVIMAAESRYLHNIQFRQCAGRSGRRGFDPIGRCIILNMSFPKMVRYVTSPLPNLRVSYTSSISLILRMLIYAHHNKENESEENFAKAKQDCELVLSQPFNHEDHVSSNQHLYYTRAGVEMLMRLDLLDKNAKPQKYSGVCQRMFYCEPNVYLFVEFVRKHLHNFIQQRRDGSKAINEEHLLIVLLNFFHTERIEETESNQHRILPSIDDILNTDEWKRTVEDFDERMLSVYISYLKQYCGGNVEEEEEEECRLPLTKFLVGSWGGGGGDVDAAGAGAAVDTANAAGHTARAAATLYNQIPALRKLHSDNCSLISSFSALSGHDDGAIKDASSLLSLVKHTVLIDLSIIPLRDRSVSYRNFILQFYEHQSLSQLVRDQEQSSIHEADCSIRDFNDRLRILQAYFSNFTKKESVVTIGRDTYILCEGANETNHQVLSRSTTESHRNNQKETRIDIRHTNEYLLSKACGKLSFRLKYQSKFESSRLMKLKHIYSNVKNSFGNCFDSTKIQVPSFEHASKERFLSSVQDALVRCGGDGTPPRLLSMLRVMESIGKDSPFSFEQQAVEYLWRRFHQNGSAQSQTNVINLLCNLLPIRDNQMEAGEFLETLKNGLEEEEKQKIHSAWQAIQSCSLEETCRFVVKLPGFPAEDAHNMLFNNLGQELKRRYKQLFESEYKNHALWKKQFRNLQNKIESRSEMTEFLQQVEKQICNRQLDLTNLDESMGPTTHQYQELQNCAIYALKLVRTMKNANQNCIWCWRSDSAF